MTAHTPTPAEEISGLIMAGHRFAHRLTHLVNNPLDLLLLDSPEYHPLMWQTIRNVGKKQQRDSPAPVTIEQITNCIESCNMLFLVAERLRVDSRLRTHVAIFIQLTPEKIALLGLQLLSLVCDSTAWIRDGQVMTTAHADMKYNVAFHYLPRGKKINYAFTDPRGEQWATTMVTPYTA